MNRRQKRIFPLYFLFLTKDFLVSFLSIHFFFIYNIHLFFPPFLLSFPFLIYISLPFLFITPSLSAPSSLFLHHALFSPFNATVRARVLYQRTCNLFTNTLIVRRGERERTKKRKKKERKSKQRGEQKARRVSLFHRMHISSNRRNPLQTIISRDPTQDFFGNRTGLRVYILIKAIVSTKSTFLQSLSLSPFLPLLPSFISRFLGSSLSLQKRPSVIST